MLRRYERVRQMLLDAGLALPDSPKIQPGAAATLAPAGDVDSSAVDPGERGAEDRQANRLVPAPLTNG